MRKISKPDECKHPSTRLYSGFYMDVDGKEKMWVGCCECGTLLRNDIQIKHAKPAKAHAPA